MRKSELFALILSIVSDITEISKEDIMSKSHKEDVVEARLLVIYFCRKEGLLPSRIAQLMGMSHRNVNRSLSAVNVLISNGGGILIINLNSIAKQLSCALERYGNQCSPN